MQLGMVGLGRMGANMVKRLLRGGHEIVAFANEPAAVKAAAADGAKGVNTLADLVKGLAAPRAHLADGAGQCRRRRHRAACAAAQRRRHHHRWRQFALSR